MSLLAKSKGEVTYKELTTVHKWALVVLISMGSSIIYAPMYLKNVFYDPLMQRSAPPTPTSASWCRPTASPP